MKKIFWIIIILLSFLCPEEYSRIYCSINFIIFLSFTIYFFRKKSKQNYWDFDTLFILVFILTSYIYPVFIYNDLYPFLPFFNNDFNTNDISKGVIASTIAGSLYIQGSLSQTKQNKEITNIAKNKINNKFIIVAAILFCILFFAAGGLNHYISNYNSFANTAPKTSSSLILQAEFLCFTCIISALGIELYNIKQFSNNIYYSSLPKLVIKLTTSTKLFNYILLAVSLTFAISIAIVGNRTIGLAIILSIIYIISLCYYNINIKNFILLIIGGFILMFSIQITRAGYEFNITNLAFDNVISDFIIPSRSNYLVYEVIEEKGISFGLTMLSPLISVIPTLDSFLNSMGINFDSSPLYFTNYTKDMGLIVNTGLGTTLQADVILAFGWPGLYLFYVLGKYVNYAYRKMQAGHLYYHTIYLCLISMSVYWVRAEFAYPARLIIWSVIITYLCTLLKSHNKK